MTLAGRRDTRIRQARAHAARVALELFLTNGYDNVTVEQICHHAGLSAATFYRYFGARDDAVFSLEAEFCEGIAEAARTHPADPLAITRAFLRFLSDHHTIVRQSDKLIQQTPALLPRALLVQRRWQTELATALAANRQELAPQLEDHLHASIILSIISAVLRAWDGQHTTDLETLLEQALNQARRLLQEITERALTPRQDEVPANCPDGRADPPGTTSKIP